MVIFAASLFFAVFAISIIFNSGGDSSGKAKAESDSYWGSASPFSAIEAIQPSDGSGTTVYIRLENRVPAYLTLHNITISTAAGQSLVNSSQVIFPNGHSQVFAFYNSPVSCIGRQGNYVQYDVEIVYDQDPLVGKVQEGQKRLAVRCS